MAEFPTCFNGKVIVITGAGGSLGGGSALEFGKSGSHLALIDIAQDRLEGAVNTMIKEGVPQNKIFHMVGDVTEQTVVDAFVAETVKRFGKIDCLINIVGIKRMGNLETTSLDDLMACMNGSVKCTFMMSKACIANLIETKGAIVNMSSVSGVRSYHLGLAYGTSKAAINHMTRIMSWGLAKKGVRVNAVCPASIRSDFNICSGTMNDAEELEKYFAISSQAIPLGRPGTVDEVVKTIMYLCSDSAGFITGAVLPVDGGYSKTMYEPPTSTLWRAKKE